MARRSSPAIGGILGGATAGASACVLAAQFAVLYPTGTVMITFVGGGATTAAGWAWLLRRTSANRVGRRSVPALSADEWVCTHIVAVPGLAAYAGPDTSEMATGWLDPWLPVSVIERWGDWALVRCSNNWTGWVDGRKLQEVQT